MLTIKLINNNDDFELIDRNQFSEFLFHHLGKFGDPMKDIGKCLDYAFSEKESEGGFALAAFYKSRLVGALVMNKTGMSGYIPENILVYIAVDKTFRGRGFGRLIIEESFNIAKGDIKLHVEFDNPAKRLYERIGFKNKYADMRYQQKN